MNIGAYTNAILDDFLSATGKISQKPMVTADEYLMFRQQAILELKQGIVNTGIETTTLTNGNRMETVAKEAPKTSESESGSFKETQPSNDTNTENEKPLPQNKITPIRQAQQKSKNDNSQLLAIMRSVDG